MTKIETARNQLETAQSKLDAALLAGTDTRELRQALIETQSKLDRLLDAAANDTAPDPTQEASIEVETQTLLDDAHARIQAAMTTALNIDRPDVGLAVMATVDGWRLAPTDRPAAWRVFCWATRRRVNSDF